MIAGKEKGTLRNIPLAVTRYWIFFLVVLFTTPLAMGEGRAYLMTNSVSNNMTLLHIINSASDAQSFTGTLYNGDGEQLGSANTALHAGSVASQARVILSAKALEELFSASSWSGPAMLVVNGSAEFDLMSKLTSPSGLVSNTNCVRQDIVHNVEGFDSDNMTFVRFINTGQSTLDEIKGTLTDTAGDVIGQAEVTLLESLNPNQAIWLNRDNLSGLFGEEWQGAASLTISESIADLKLLNLNFVNGETFFNFSCFENSDSKHVYLMTNSASENISNTHIINTSSASDAFTGTLYNGDGDQLGDADVPLHNGSIAANGRTILTADDLEQSMNIDAWSGPALLEVQGASSFELMSKLTSPSGLISNTNCVRQGNVQNIEGADSDNLTYVRFINQGTTTISDITGSLFDINGAMIGEADTVLVQSLAPKAAVFLNRDQISTLFGTSWSGEASLVVGASDDTDLRLLNLNLVNGETFFNFSCYERGTVDEGTSPEPEPEPEPEVELLGGVWTGTITSNQGTDEFVGVTTDDGSYRFFSLETLVQFHGEFSGSADQLSGTGLAVPDGETEISTSLSVQIVERETITGTWSSTSSNDGGVINLQYWNIYERSGSVSKLDGNWTARDSGVPFLQLNLSSGVMSGTDFINCSHNGSIAPVDSTYNTYIISDTLSQCAISGLYVGFATLTDGSSMEDSLLFAVDNGTYYIAGTLEKD